MAEKPPEERNYLLLSRLGKPSGHDGGIAIDIAIPSACFSKLIFKTQVLVLVIELKILKSALAYF